VAVVEQVFADKTGVRLFADNVIADCVSNIRRCAFRRPLLENLRIAGMIIRVYQEYLGLAAALLKLVIYVLIVNRLYADAIGVVCVFGYFIDVVVVLGVFSRNPFKTVLEIIIVGDAFADQALLLRDLWIFTFQRAYLS